jgi:DNA-binding NarL/FixJ family response regulator
MSEQYSNHPRHIDYPLVRLPQLKAWDADILKALSLHEDQRRASEALEWSYDTFVTRLSRLKSQLHVHMALPAVLMGIKLRIVMLDEVYPEKVNLYNVFSLSTNQQKVFTCLGFGYDDKDIADETGLSRSSIGVHTTKLYQKLNLDNRIQAGIVSYALQNDYL